MRMTLKQRWLRCLPVGLILAALVLLIVWLVQPRSFSDVIRSDGAEEFYVYTSSVETERELLSARPNREEMEPLLDLLKEGTLRLTGRSRTIQWQIEDTLYHLSFYHGENGMWVQDASFDLCTDGMVYISHDWLGYLCYELSGCDMGAIGAQLEQMLGM